MKRFLRKQVKNVKTIGLLLPDLELGGMQRVAINLAELFKNNGYEVVCFVGSYNKRRSYEYTGKIIRICSYIDNSRTTKEINSYICNAYNLKKLKKEYGIDCTISFAPEMNLLNMLSDTRDKKILTIHNCTSLRDDVRSIAYNKFFMKFGNYATKIVTVCNWCKDDLIKNYGIHPLKIQTIYNQSFLNNQSNKSQQCQNMIICVGRLEEIKQQWHVLKAFKTVEDELHNYKLIFIGDGGCIKKLKRLTASLDLTDRVEYVGFVRNVHQFYAKGSILVSTSKSEAFPCVAVEAMYYGMPIVAFDVPGGLSEAMGVVRQSNHYPLNAEAGIITEHCNSDTNWENTEINMQEIMLGKAILKLLTNRELYEEKSLGAKKMSKMFDEKTIGKQWTDLMEE